MKRFFPVTGLILGGGLLLSPSAWAQEPGTFAASLQDAQTTSPGKPVFVQNIAASAIDAVAVVDAFSAAIKAVQLDQASDLLDPAVLILESGSSERSRDEYLASHAAADAAFMHNAQQQLRYRQAQADAGFAWVATESLLQVVEDGKTVLILSTETMLLKKTTQGWKIVHIHWSSRPAS